MAADPSAWWRHGLVYQVYPRSFQDTDGDGVGDLPGIVQRLPYLAGLGVDAVWISPIYPSPMRDFGYDVSDHTGVHPLFGTLDDFDRLVAEAHWLGLRVVLDYVPNHTSDEHPWFRDSRSSRSNPKRDWYIWRDPAPDGGPPSNWLSEFGGSAWTLDGATGQYWYHAYLPEQPDLNWRNPDVRAAMLDVLRFWFARGVDGFRVDAVHHLFEDEALRDNPPNPDWRSGMSPARSVIRAHTMDLPEVQDVAAAMRRVADEYGGGGDRVLIGEAYLPIPRMMAYYGTPAAPGFHLPFNFHLLSTPWEARRIAALVAEYEAALQGVELPGGAGSAWPNWVLGNHDRSRVASRLGPAQARVAAMLLLTLRGTPTIYQGEEIGMQDVPIPPDRVQDPWERRVPGLGLGRDPVRTPMQWDPFYPNAGFTKAPEPWLPLEAEWQTRNIFTQDRPPGAGPTAALYESPLYRCRQDPALYAGGYAVPPDGTRHKSMLVLYRALLTLRRAEPALHAGSYVPIAEPAPDVLAYERRDEATGRRLLVLLNLASETREASLGQGLGQGGTILLSTGAGRADGCIAGRLRLGPDEGVVIGVA